MDNGFNYRYFFLGRVINNLAKTQRRKVFFSLRLCAFARLLRFPNDRGQSFSLICQKNASAIPDIICHIPHHAATKAIPPKPSKSFGLKISTNPKPEFCIPLSIVTDLKSGNERRANLPIMFPDSKANALCKITNMPIKWIYFLK